MNKIRGLINIYNTGDYNAENSAGYYEDDWQVTLVLNLRRFK